MGCVNTKLPEFIEASNRLNINRGELELIVHKFINTEGNETSFPSDQYILEQLSPSAFEATDKQLEMFFKARHDIPMQFTSADSYRSALRELQQYYPATAIKGYKNANGLYTIQVATPKVKGIPMVLDNSMIDSFMKGIQQDNPYHELFGKLITALGKENINIKMQKEAPIGRSGKPSYAQYDPNRNEIVFFTDSILRVKENNQFSDAYTRRYLFKTLTHELLHQLTYKTIENPISAAGKEFVNNIQQLYDDVLSHFNGDRNAYYGLFDLHEFVSEAMTNIDFQIQLAKIKTNRGEKSKSLWSKFVDAVGNFFRQKFGMNISNTVLQDAITDINSFVDYATEFKEQNDLYNESLDQLLNEIPQSSYSELHEALKAFRGDWNRPSYKGFTTGRFENTIGKWRIIVPETFRGTLVEAHNIINEMLTSKGATPEMYSLGSKFESITDKGVTYTTIRVGFKPKEKTRTKVKDKIKVSKNKLSPEDIARQDAINQLLEVRPDLKFQIDNDLIDVDYLINHPDEINALASSVESPGEELTRQQNAAQLKPKYKGKLIYAQSGTGKSTIADNVNVIDSDYLLGQILGVSTETAGFFFNTLSAKQKKVLGEQYRNLIRQKVAEGKTVLTANAQMLNEADTVVYNSSVAQTEQRVNSEDRAINNRYSDPEYHNDTLNQINELRQNDQNKEYIELDSEHYLGDYMLSPRNDNISNSLSENVSENQSNDVESLEGRNESGLTYERLVNDFLATFGFTVNNLASYDNSIPLFDALHKVMNVTSPEQITDAMGYAVAFMMQGDPEMQRIITQYHGREGDYSTKVKIPFLKKPLDMKNVTQALPWKQVLIQETGKEIAQQLREHFDQIPDKDSLPKEHKSLWDMIKRFFNKLATDIFTLTGGPLKAIQRRKSAKNQQKLFVKDVVAALARRDFSRLLGPQIKPGTTEIAQQVELEQAFKDYPFEREIIKKLSDAHMGLAGSASIALEGPLYRPAENPLHDIDFATPDNTTKADLDKLMPQIFGEKRVAYVSQINKKGIISLLTGDNSGGTVTYVTFDRDFQAKRVPSTQKGISQIQEYYDLDGNYLGKKYIKKGEGVQFELEDGVQGKLLDFFIGPTTESKPGFYTKTINGQDYLIAHASGAMEAKILWARPKDMWDYKRFKYDTTPNESTVEGKDDSILADENEIKLKRKFELEKKEIEEITRQVNREWNLPQKLLNTIVEKIRKYNEARQLEVRDVNPIQYFDNTDKSTVGDILDRISKLSDDKDIRELAKYLMRKGGKFSKIPVIKTNKKRGSRGQYFTSGKIHINQAAMTGRTDKEALNNYEATMLHEIAHALTVDAYNSNKELRRELATLFNEFKAISEKYGMPNMYATKNPKEFMAEFLGKKSFREVLMNLKPENEHKSFGQKILDFIKKCFGIKTRSAFFNKADDVISRILDANETYTNDVFEVYEDLNDNYQYLIGPNEIKPEYDIDELLNFNQRTIYNSYGFEERDNNWGVPNIDDYERDNPFEEYDEENIMVDVENGILDIVEKEVTDPEKLIEVTTRFMYDAMNPTGTELWMLNDSNASIIDAYDNFRFNLIFQQDALNAKYTDAMRNKESIIATEGEEGFNNIIKDYEQAQQDIDYLNSVREAVLRGLLKYYVRNTPNNKIAEVLRMTQDSPIEGVLFQGFDLSDTLNELRNEILQKDAESNVGQLTVFDDYKVSPVRITNNYEEALSAPYADQLLSEPDVESAIHKQQNENDPFLKRSITITTQLDNLRNSGIITQTEVREIANDIAYWISDFITDLQTRQEDILNNLAQYGYDVDKLRDLDFSSMTRADVVKYFGVNQLIKRAKEQFHPSNNEENEYYDDYNVVKQMYLVQDNFEGVMRYVQSTLSNIEKFNIKYNDKGLAEIEENTTDSIDADDFNNTNSEEEIKEVEGSEAEHWMIESRTRDIMDDMGKAVENALVQCFILDSDGNRVKSARGIDQRVDRRQATNSIVRWTQGALTLNDMIQKLQEKQEQNPWVSQLIERLQDDSGKETDLQSQFFSNFYKPFQLFSIIKYENGEFKAMPINEHKALSEATKGIKAQYNTGKHPLFTTDGVNLKTLSDLEEAYNSIVETLNDKNIDYNNEDTKKSLAKDIAFAANCLGYYTVPEIVEGSINKSNVGTIKNALHWITKSLNENKDNKSFEPFVYGSPGNIEKNVKDFLRPLTDQLEDIAVSSFYENGKMYQSYVTPSYMTKLAQKFKLTGDRFQEFIQNEFKNYDWFYDKNGNGGRGQWLNEWIQKLATDEKARKVFAHKVQLSFNKKNYMKNMDDMEYAMSLIAEYFSEAEGETQALVPAWFRIPMISNKPSSEFIRFYSHRGLNYKDTIARGIKNVFNQEMRRIQTVNMRNRSKGDSDFIKNLDTKGKEFNFLPFFNKYLEEGYKNDAYPEFGRLLRSKIRGEKLQPGEESKLFSDAVKIIKDEMQLKSDAMIATWEKQGILEAAKKIKGIGKNPKEIRENLENFVWNDFYAAINITELTLTDIAYYKDAEDLQKRLAQIHSPGIRPNVDAVDYEGRKVSDGFTRTFYLKDFENVVSNIIENVKIVFDRKIQEALAKNNNTQAKGLRILRDNLVGEDGQFRQINVTDAQGYCCPTAYRKKALLFGKWSKEREALYEKIRSGKWEYSDIKEAFQPLKPFVYSQIQKPVNAAGAPMQNFKMGVQNKNSEYLLILADAILQGENTGRPNLLRAIYEVMEESHFDAKGNYRADGIDTVQFESTVKTGLMGAMDINQFMTLKPFENLVDGEQKAKALLQTCIYKGDYRPTRLEVNPRTHEIEQVQSNAVVSKNEYNDTFVHTIPLEDYSLQQETPEHFKNHEQAHGSQGRYIIPSELAEFDAFGNEVLYTVKNVVTNEEGKTEVREEKVNANTFKERYEKNIADNIQDSIDQLKEELHLTGSVRDRNIAISKLLQREILNSPNRYGVDLLLACSVDEYGTFRIPLGDPIQSKRIEQLLNSIIKNRVNKQKIPGGPVVQVSNFGTSRELNIRFKDKNGGLLMTRAEWESSKEKNTKDGSTYEDYIKENQGGIAHFEVFASIYNQDLLKFADKDGNIDIDTIELINPDLLKMIGYRIPTEAKYSMAPLKIVGFLPREAGAAIMLPNDITLLTGSDFDIDKEYLMRKEFDIAFRYEPKSLNSMSEEEIGNLSEAEQDWIKHNRRSIQNEIREKLSTTSPLTKREYAQLEKQLKQELQSDLKYEERRHQRLVKEINDEYDELIERIKNKKYSEDAEKNADTIATKEKNLNKKRESAIKREDKRYKNSREKIETDFRQDYDTNLNKLIKKFEKNKINNAINDFFQTDRFQPAKNDNLLTRAIRKAYLDYAVKVIEPTSGRTFRNNQIVDMTYEVLTHEQSAAEMLNPGGFDPQKRMGYMVAAYKDSNNNYTWEQLQKMSISELKDLCQVDKNLMDIGTHIQFYKQNSAAGSLIGIFAVERVAHAVIENEGYKMDVFKACSIKSPFTVMSTTFGEDKGLQVIDVRQNDAGESVGKILGSLVASAADAVKDPVLNLMNINSNTASVLNTLIRLGMPFEDAALFLSTAAVSNVLETFSRENLSGFKAFATVISERLNKIEEEQGITSNSPIQKEELTKKEIINSLKNEDMTLDAEYKILKALKNFRSMADAMKLPTFATRFNSISNAVGPLAIDNLITDYKMRKLNQESAILDKNNKEVNAINIMAKHPILEKFYSTQVLAKDLLKGLPANSQSFEDLLYSVSGNKILDTVMNDRKLLSSLSDFYQSSLLIYNDIVNEEDLKYYITKFPEEFLSKDYKTKYKDNLLIQSIRFGNDKADRLTLQVELTGVDTADKEKIGDGWSDLYNKDPELAMKLFNYCFFRGGIGFNPKSFMALLPMQMKERIPGYLDTFRILPPVLAPYVIDQFVRNNWDNNKLVPIKDGLNYKKLKNNQVEVTAKTDEEQRELGELQYFKTRVEENGVEVDKLYQIVNVIQETNKKPRTIFKEIQPLGSNKDYIEISKNDITKATETTNKVVEDTVDPGTQDTDVAENNTVTPDAEIPPTMSDEDKIRANLDTYQNLALSAWMNANRSAQEALDEINKFRNRPEREKAQMKKSLKNFFTTQLKNRNLPFDEETVEKVYESIC